jgi:hypothetical protein
MSKTSAAWKIYRTRFLVKAKQLDEPLSFEDALGRQHCGRPGDYLIESSDGSRSIQRREIFEDIYVPMGPAGEDHSPSLPGTIPTIGARRRISTRSPATA